MQLNEPQINIRDTKNYAEFLIISSKKIYYLFIIESIIKDKNLGFPKIWTFSKMPSAFKTEKAKRNEHFFPNKSVLSLSRRWLSRTLPPIDSAESNTASRGGTC